VDAAQEEWCERFAACLTRHDNPREHLAFFFILLEIATMTTIHMDSSVSQTATRAVMNGGVLSCTKTSDKDVYSHSIWATESNIRQFTMH